MKSSYYEKKDICNLNYIMLPMALLEDEYFEDMTLMSKVIYGYLYNRMKLSQRNGWIDDNNRVYIFYPVKELSAKFKKHPKSIKRYLSELEEHSLIEIKENDNYYSNTPYIYVKQIDMNDVKGIYDDYEQIGTDYSSYKDFEDMDEEDIYAESITKKNKPFRKPHNNRREMAKGYGSEENVFLTSRDMKDLKNKIPYLKQLIERLSLYMKSTGKRYRDYKATLLLWHLKDKEKEKRNSKKDFNYKKRFSYKKKEIDDRDRIIPLEEYLEADFLGIANSVLNAS